MPKLTSEPTAPEAGGGPKDWIIVESYQFAHNAGTDGKGYVLTSIQHGTTDTSLVDQSGTEASSRLFVGNLTLDSQASAGGEDSWVFGRSTLSLTNMTRAPLQMTFAIRQPSPQ